MQEHAAEISQGQNGNNLHSAESVADAPSTAPEVKRKPKGEKTNGKKRQKRKVSAHEFLIRATPPQIMSVEEASWVSTLALRTIKSAIADRDLKVTKQGRRVLVRLQDLQTFLSTPHTFKTKRRAAKEVRNGSPQH